jgi:hypothetical protein
VPEKCISEKISVGFAKIGYTPENTKVLLRDIGVLVVREKISEILLVVVMGNPGPLVRDICS